MLRFIALIVFLLSNSYATARERDFFFALNDEKSRPAIMYIPKSKKSETLLVVLHGGSRNAKLAMTQDSEGEWNQIAEDYGWMVLYPSGTTNQKDQGKLLWNDCRLIFGNVGPATPNTNDVEYLDALIKKLIKDQGLKNIFITGHSNGGGMTFRMAMESTIPLAGIAPMLMNLPRNTKRCKDSWIRPLPTAFLLGTKDPMVSFPGGTKGRSGVETLDWIRKKNSATWKGPKTIYTDVVKDDGPSTIVRNDFGPSKDLINVSYFEVLGGGHQVPGPAPVEKWMVDWLGPKNRDLSLRREIANFFENQIQQSNSTKKSE